MKTFLLIAGLTLARGLPAQNSPPDSTVAKEITEKKKENKKNAIISASIVLTFFGYMYFLIRHETR